MKVKNSLLPNVRDSIVMRCWLGTCTRSLNRKRGIKLVLLKAVWYKNNMAFIIRQKILKFCYEKYCNPVITNVWKQNFQSTWYLISNWKKWFGLERRKARYFWYSMQFFSIGNICMPILMSKLVFIKQKWEITKSCILNML